MHFKHFTHNPESSSEPALNLIQDDFSHCSAQQLFFCYNFLCRYFLALLEMGKENSPAFIWRWHQQCLNPCDPQKGAFGKIWQRQRKENGDHRGQLEEIKKEVPEVNIPIPVGVFDTKEQES